MTCKKCGKDIYKNAKGEWADGFANTSCSRGGKHKP